MKKIKMKATTRTTNLPKTKSARALDLLLQNPGLTLKAASQFIGIKPITLTNFLKKQALIGAGKCPTCHRYFKPLRNRPAAFTQDKLPIFPKNNLEYDRMTRHAKKISHNKLTHEEHKIMVREVMEKAKRRLLGLQPKVFKGYIRNQKWKLSSVQELSNLL